MQTKIRYWDPKAKDPKESVKEEVINGEPGPTKQLYETMGYQVEVLGTETGDEMIIGPGGQQISKAKMEKIMEEQNKAKIEALHKTMLADSKINPNGLTDLSQASAKLPMQLFPPNTNIVLQPEFIYFEEAGVKFRVNKSANIVEKLDLIQIKDTEIDNYAIQTSNKNSKIIPLKDSKIILFKKDWIPIK